MATSPPLRGRARAGGRQGADHGGGGGNLSCRHGWKDESKPGVKAMTSIPQILARKPDVYATDPDATVLDALKRLEQKNIGALLVMKADRLAGIFSERDYARRMILHGRSSRETAVREVMTTEVFTIGVEASAGECMTYMTERHVRHLPVLEGGRVVGVISIGDIVQAVMEDMRFTIRQLEAYIRSGG
jgi:CBS domain-containing protein